MNIDVAWKQRSGQPLRFLCRWIVGMSIMGKITHSKNLRFELNLRPSHVYESDAHTTKPFIRPLSRRVEDNQKLAALPTSLN